ncbi:limbic system-associated membrane protein isoform X1 [Tachysurus ichikawai]
MSVRRSACCCSHLHATLFRLLCVLLPAGFPARSVDVQRATDNITVRQGDTAVIRVKTRSRVFISALVKNEQPRLCRNTPGSGAHVFLA